MLVDNDVYINKYVANGSTTSFSIAFPFLEASHIEVYTRGEDGEDILVDPSMYTITGAGIEEGGELTFNTPPTAGTVIAIIRNVPITQLYAYTELDNFPAESHENALAKLTMIDQQQAEILGRAVIMPVTSSKTPSEYMAEFKSDMDAAVDTAQSAAEDAAESRDEAANILMQCQEIADSIVVSFNNQMATVVMTTAVDVPSGTTITLPEDGGRQVQYEVGSHALQVFYNGAAMFPGSQYEEVGTDGDASDEVKLLQELRAGDELMFHVFGLDAASLVDGESITWDPDTGLSVNIDELGDYIAPTVRVQVDEFIGEDLVDYQKTNTRTWSAGKDYTAGALVTGSDGDLYVAVQPSGPSTSVVDPVKDLAGIWVDLSLNRFLKQKATVKPFIHDDSFLDATSLNGSVCDDDYLYSVYVKVVKVGDVYVNRKAFVQRIDLSSGYIDFLDPPSNTTLAIVEHSETDPDDQSSTISSLGHANGMTCDDDYLYVATQIDARIIKLDKETLQVVETYDTTDKGNKFRSIAYNDADGYFYGLSYSDSQVHVFDSDFNEIGTKSLGFDYTHYTLQGLCFKDGEMYGFSFANNASDTREYYNYMIKFDHAGRISHAWLLDISREVENICAFGDGFLVGVNTAYGSRYDYYTVSLSEDTLTVPADILETDRDIDDYANGNGSQCIVICKKRSDRTGLVDGVSKTSTYKLVGNGKTGTEFAYVEDAVSYAKRIERMNYHTQQIILQLKGDFSDKSYVLSGIKTRLVFTVKPNTEDTAKLGPLVITDCNCVQLWNGSISIELSDATKTESVVAGISAVNSFVLAGVDITNTASPKTGTIGIYSQRGAVVEIPQNITLTNFATGVSFYNGSLIQDDASQITFTDCTAKFTGTRRGIVHVDADNAPAILASPQASVATPVNNLMSNDIRISADGNTKYTHIYRRGDGTNYKGALMESVSGSTTGAYLILRDPDSPAETGWFNLAAKNSTTTVMLLGKPDGSLLWNGNPVQTTSDERKKTMFSPVPDATLDAWGEVNWEQFKYLAALEEKGGAENCRWHSGLVAQHVQNAFEALGQDACAYGILCHEEWDDEYEEKKVIDAEARHDEFGNEVVPEQSHIERVKLRDAGDLWTVRYTEALCMEAAYQRRRAARAEARLAALERKTEEMEQVIAVLGMGGEDDE